MRKLISLEINKYQLFSYWKAIIIANVAILALTFLVFKTDDIGATYSDSFAAIEAFVRTTFTIFASVIVAKLFIEEYRSNTITLMFMYPISRKKIMTAKMIIVSSFSFLSVVLSNIVIGLAFYGLNQLVHIIPGSVIMEDVKSAFISMLLGAVATSGISLIPLFFGLWKKSIPATIVSAIILVSLTGSSSNGITLFSYIAIPITLAVIGYAIAFFAIRNIDRADV